MLSLDLKSQTGFEKAGCCSHKKLTDKKILQQKKDCIL